MSEPRATCRIGTRASALARWQAEWVAGELRSRVGADVELVPISTRGDEVRDRSLGALGETGLFTKEIQRALVEGEVDVAVHSLKDLPTEEMTATVLAAVPERASHADVIVCRDASGWDTLREGSVIGTGSPRRRAQLRYARRDVVFADIRGNVETRLRKLREGEFDAIVLAEAGLVRLGLADEITEVLRRELVLPAVGQGALGIETRADDDRTRALVAHLNDAPTVAAVTAERAMLAKLRGGCMAPVGGFGCVDSESGQLALEGVVLSADGERRVRANSGCDTSDAVALGERVAEQLLADGAAELIATSRDAG